MLPETLLQNAALIGLCDAVVCAALGGWIWRRKGGELADGIGLGGILGLVGLILVLVLRPKASRSKPPVSEPAAPEALRLG